MNQPKVTTMDEVYVEAYSRLLIENYNLHERIEGLTRSQALFAEDAFVEPSTDNPLGVREMTLPEIAQHYGPFTASLKRQVIDLQQKNSELETRNRALCEKQKPSLTGFYGLDTLTPGMAIWVIRTFGEGAQKSRRERAFRFVEEALELAQACGLSHGDVANVGDYVYSRPMGNLSQEVGGVMLTLGPLAENLNISLWDAAMNAFVDCTKSAEQIKKKHWSKPPAILGWSQTND